ncbi:SH3 domain-containing protein [Blautia sp. MSJ-19]|uniref:SH3 domain-containing protein n=1 Tax=Blautia sp. MSJ-19 TaxID=2841517 RepID=UPI001C0EE60F|nr:SH3 domain-containing protein [Blautia sp. MSJ-19]MBU5482374.1 SH3 domain-containing protein [Blautia sp. MSJ-19]
MKKSRLLIVLAGLAVAASGCGYSTGGEDSTVTVIEATPTPTATPTPEVTPTPEATPTPAPEMSQTASGVNIIKQDATYYAIEGVNVRSDCSTDAQIITGTTVGQTLTSTGVSEDGQWVEVSINDQTGYVNAQYVSTEAPAGTTTADATAAAQ